tara:strand:- start:1189 stop:1341 length:153 start_codon:yes stop_codon:yes gene_type:complete
MTAQQQESILILLVIVWVLMMFWGAYGYGWMSYKGRRHIKAIREELGLPE